MMRLERFLSVDRDHRRTMRVVFRVAVVVGAALLASTALGTRTSPASGVEGGSVARWTIRELGTLGGKESAALDINKRGQVVGWAEIRKRTIDGAIRHAVLWHNGKTIDLGAKYLAWYEK